MHIPRWYNAGIFRAGFNSRPAVTGKGLQSASRMARSGAIPEPTVQSGWKKMEQSPIFILVFVLQQTA